MVGLHGRCRVGFLLQSLQGELPQKYQKLPTHEIDEGRTDDEPGLGEPGVEAAGNEEGAAEETDRETEEGDSEKKQEFASPGVASRGEHEADIEEVVDDRSDGKGDQVAEDGIALLQGIVEPSFDEVVVSRENGVGKPGEEAQVHEGSDSSEEDIFGELEGYGGILRLEPVEGRAKPAFSEMLQDKRGVGADPFSKSDDHVWIDPAA